MIQTKKMMLISVGIALAAVSFSAEANLLTNGTLQGSTAQLGGSTTLGYCYEPVGANFYANGSGTNSSECTSAINGWSGYFGVIGSNSSIWGSPSAISGWQSSFGTNVAGLQAINSTGTAGTHSTLEQTVSVAAGQSLTLSWYDAMRQGYGYTTTSPYGTSAGYEVLFDGLDIGNYTVSVSNPWEEESLTFTAPSSGTLEFESVDINQSLAQSDATAFIADVNLASSAPSNVPEPASIFLVGIALAGLVYTRRQSL